MEQNIIIENLLNELDSSIDKLIEYGKESAKSHSSLFMFDVYVTGILNRSVNIIRGFSILMRDNNFIAAAPLVRIHLDSLLRLFAPQLINFNVDDFSMQVFQGKAIRKIKDKDNCLMNDSHLVKKLSEIEDFEWVQKVYEAGNSFIHFSDQTIFASLKHTGKENIVNFTIGKHDGFIAFSEKHGAVIWMIKITQAILGLVLNWTEQKRGYNQNGG